MKKITVLIFAVAAAFIFLGLPQPAKAACSSAQSTFTIITRDAGGTLVPNINFAIYQQNTDPDGHPYLGSSLASGKTDAGGQASACVKSSGTGLYAVKFYEYGANYGYTVLWHQDLVHTDQNYSIEIKLSYLRVIFRDAEGGLLKNIAFDIYVQEYDADGQPIIGESKLNQDKLVYNKYNTGATGTTRAYLAAGTYVLRIHGTGNTYFYLWAQQLTDEQAKLVEYRLGTVRVVVEDALGNLLKNRKFSVYEQAYDAHDQPALGEAIVANLDTGSLGKKDVYLPTGNYAFTFTGSQSDKYFTKYKVSAADEALKKFTYRLAGIRVIISDAKGQLLYNQKFTIAEQASDANNKPVVGKTVAASTTGTAGLADFYLTPKRYAFIYGTNKIYNIEVFENQIATVEWPKSYSLRPATGEMMLVNSFSNVNLTLRVLTGSSIQGIKNIVRKVGNPYLVRADKINKLYTVVFFYNKPVLQNRGINTDKLRLAFYNESTKKWSLVGWNFTAQSRLAVASKAPGIYTVVEVK